IEAAHDFATGATRHGILRSRLVDTRVGDDFLATVLGSQPLHEVSRRRLLVTTLQYPRTGGENEITGILLREMVNLGGHVIRPAGFVRLDPPVVMVRQPHGMLARLDGVTNIAVLVFV